MMVPGLAQRATLLVDRRLRAVTRIVRCWVLGVMAGMMAVLAASPATARVTATWAGASPAAHRSGPEVLHLKFRRAGTAGPILVGRGYVFLGSAINGAFGGTLVDERTGKRSSIERPGCIAEFFGGPWLLFECGTPTLTQVALYRPATRRWRVLSWDADVLGYPDAVGAYWIESVLYQSCPDWNDHCDNIPHHTFTRITTGAQGTVEWVPDGNIVPGLDSPSLAHKLCSPLRVPHVSFPTDVGDALLPGTVTMFGRFAIASGTTLGADAEVEAQDRLERCQSKLRQPIIASTPAVDGAQPSRTPIGDPHAIVWPSKPRQLTGIFLPSLRQFTVPVPANIGPVQATTGPVTTAILASKTLYLQTSTQELWAAPAPSPPPKRPASAHAS
jgi:hypothetical protein